MAKNKTIRVRRSGALEGVVATTRVDNSNLASSKFILGSDRVGY